VRQRLLLIDTGVAAAVAALVLILAPGVGAVALILLVFAVVYLVSRLASLAARNLARRRNPTAPRPAARRPRRQH
jgi:hypothetical protein